MTTALRRLSGATAKVAAVLSALAIAGYLVWRAQAASDRPLPSPGQTPADDAPPPVGLSPSRSLVIDNASGDGSPWPANIVALPPGLHTSKSLVIDKSFDHLASPSPIRQPEVPLLPSSKSIVVPAPTPPAAPVAPTPDRRQ